MKSDRHNENDVLDLAGRQNVFLSGDVTGRTYNLEKEIDTSAQTARGACTRKLTRSVLTYTKPQRSEIRESNDNDASYSTLLLNDLRSTYQGLFSRV